MQIFHRTEVLLSVNYAIVLAERLVEMDTVELLALFEVDLTAKEHSPCELLKFSS